MSSEKINEAVGFIVKKLNPSFIILFGSYAKGTTHTTSDLDIAFYHQTHSFNSYELFMFRQELADMLKMEVDLVDLGVASTVFQAQILSTGKVVYSKDENLRKQVTMTSYSMYSKLNEERFPILKRIEEVGSFTKNDVILNKISVIERCISRVNDVYDNKQENLQDYTKQDSIILNIQRACEASIDLAMHIVAEKRLGLPQTSRDAFDLLFTDGIIDDSTNRNLKAMVGFRNIAVHDYQTINNDILKSILDEHLLDFTDYTKQILKSS